ncbi:MAG: HTH domain-containing protein [Deltaproteobacteria bacterium]|nr:HTH domain-containing protein [Deltaproteobacteria bacterium]
MARKKKIPSIDYSIKLIVERVRDELKVEMSDVVNTLAEVQQKLAVIERRIGTLQQAERWATLRTEMGTAVSRHERVSPEMARKFILESLTRAHGEYVPSSELGGPLGIGRATVAARMKELRGEGYEILSAPRKGYALVEDE